MKYYSASYIFIWFTIHLRVFVISSKSLRPRSTNAKPLDNWKPEIPKTAGGDYFWKRKPRSPKTDYRKNGNAPDLQDGHYQGRFTNNMFPEIIY